MVRRSYGIVFFLIGIHCVFSDVCLNRTIFSTYSPTVNDSTDIDSTIFTYNEELDGFLTFEKSSSSDCQKYFKLNGTEVKLVKSLKDDCSIEFIRCRIFCTSSSDKSGQDFRASIVRVPFGKIFFNQQNYTYSVLENSSPPELFSCDGEINQTDCTHNVFGSLQINNNDSGPFEAGYKTVNLIEGQQLDYDGGKYQYRISLSYTEGSRTADTTLIINVQDVDDMDPVFNESLYIYKVFENTVDTEWKSTEPEIAAYDRDLGDGRQNISFYFIDGTSTKDNITINPSSGKIKVLQELDRESPFIYEYKLKVVQNNNHLRSATTSLTITVMDKNDNLPQFTKPKYKANVDEHSSPGTFLCKVSAVDKDESPNTTYKLENYTDLLNIESDDDDAGIVTVKDSEKLDRETLGDVIFVWVVAIDTTNQTEGGNATLEIRIRDINDNSPKFTKEGYTFVLRNISEVIGQVNATDDDSRSNGNGEVVYSILHASSVSPVKINATSGEIYLIYALADDTEVYVEACDNPVQQSSRRCSQVLVSLMVNSTEIKDVILYANVSENVHKGTIVTFISIKGTYYRIVSENASFTIGESSGVVSTSEIIDRENGPLEHILNIHVFTKTHRVFANITLYITVLDVNDNAPVYEKYDYFFELPETVAKGHVIGQVKATDADTNENGIIQYVLADSIVSRYFTVDNTSGEISVGTHDLPAEKELFQLVLVARDRGIPPLKASCNIYVSKTVVEKGFVRISSTAESSALQKERDYYEKKIGDILRLIVKIEDIIAFSATTRRTKRSLMEPSLYKTRSFMYISATNSTGAAIPIDELQKKVLEHMEGIQALFMSNSVLMTSTDSTLSASSIALIVMAAVILVGGVIAIYVIFKTRSSKSRNSSLSGSIEEEKGASKDKISLQSIEIAVNLDEEPEPTSDYDGSQNSNEQLISEEDNRGVTNHIYQQSETTTLENIDIDKMTTDQAVEHLNRLNEVLNKEESDTPFPDYEIVDTLEDSPRSQGRNSERDDNVYENNAKTTNYQNDLESNDDNNITPAADYENTGTADDSENTRHRDLDEESGEFIASNGSQNESGTELKRQNNDKTDDISDEEPDVDYNDKQVRFSTVVLDTEENKFEPIKLEKDNTEETDERPTIDDENDENDEATCSTMNIGLTRSNLDDDSQTVIEEITAL